MEIHIRSLDRKDIPQILEIQKQNPSAAQWKEADYDSLFSQPGRVALAATEASAGERQAGAILGFAIFRQVVDEAELLNLAVEPSCQRRGIGRDLLREGMRQLVQAQAQFLFLEVRGSNQAALALYASMGFERLSLRPAYYQNPCEDGYILCAQLPGRKGAHPDRIAPAQRDSD
ncbi:MAG: ribosomal protein S18-alanine N-acetyltransferase [Terriglobia bacterium]